MNLPLSAIPWGRFMSDSVQSLRTGLEAEAENANSVGSQFAARLNSMSGIIASIGRYSVQSFTFPGVSQSITSGATETIVSAPFSAPLAPGAVSAIIIANFTIERTGLTASNAKQPFMMVQGRRYGIFSSTFPAVQTASIRGDLTDLDGNSISGSVGYSYGGTGTPGVSGSIVIPSFRLHVISYGATP